VADLINIHDWEREAVARLQPDVVGYLTGGAGDERALAGNRAAFERLRLVPRVLPGVERTDLATTVLGAAVSMPVLVAPVGHQRLFHPDGEVASARAAVAAGTVYCLSTMANASVEEVAAAVPGSARWFQLYARRDRTQRLEIVRRAEAAGYAAIVLTVDLVSHGRRERDRRTGFRLPPGLPVPNLLNPGEIVTTIDDTADLLDHALGWNDVAALISATSLPVVLKGILHPDDAVRAADTGCAGVIVSNHGGRQLDGAIAPIDALPAIAAAVGGRLEVYLDSGVRRGEDVVAALALGARAVLVGRALMYGLVVGGESGVAAVLEVLRAEVANALHLCGVVSAAAVPRDLVEERGLANVPRRR
jgi:4-hydroxymandelate oxidase